MPEPLPGFPFSPLECRRGTTGLIADEQLILGQHAGSNWNVKLTNTIGFERTRRKSDCPLFRKTKWICGCHLDRFSFLSYLMFIISWCRTFLLFNSLNLPSGPSNGLWNCTDPLFVCLGSLPDPSQNMLSSDVDGESLHHVLAWATSSPALPGPGGISCPGPVKQERCTSLSFCVACMALEFIFFFTVPSISMFWKRCANPFLFRFLKLPHLEIYAEPHFNQSVNLLSFTVCKVMSFSLFFSRFSWFFFVIL